MSPIPQNLRKESPIMKSRSLTPNTYNSNIITTKKEAPTTVESKKQPLRNSVDMGSFRNRRSKSHENEPQMRKTADPKQFSDNYLSTDYNPQTGNSEKVFYDDQGRKVNRKITTNHGNSVQASSVIKTDNNVNHIDAPHLNTNFVTSQ